MIDNKVKRICECCGLKPCKYTRFKFCEDCIVHKCHKEDKTEFINSTKLDDKPTEHLPGSEGKIQVMIDRVRRNVLLFHPDDAKANIN